MAYFVNLVRSGDPNYPNPVPVEWPLYNSTNRPYLEFDVNMTSGNVKTDLLSSQMFFWNRIFPSINAAGITPEVVVEESTPLAPLRKAEDGQSGTNFAEVLRSTQAVVYTVLGIAISLLLLLIILGVQTSLLRSLVGGRLCAKPSLRGKNSLGSK
ncbi:hypothetical protein Bbelb_401150 [Branchiostoma belcheri]|nr:hypothetical protein Bbelb_401150 [Branchiostoma belcheri]